MYKRFCVSIVSVALLVAQSGCATIVSDKSYPVTFISEPPGAKVEVKDQKGTIRYSGFTPATAVLDSGNGYFTRARYTVTTTKEGYGSSSQEIPTSLNGWYWGNILFGGLIGLLIVDPISGAMYRIDNQSMTFNMSPASDAVTISPASTNSSPDVTERILRLKKLRVEGVLTETEFQAKKRAILKDM